jgi:hypothetical protein
MLDVFLWICVCVCPSFRSQQYYDSFLENKSLHIIMEHCENGDLHQVRFQCLHLSVHARSHSCIMM